MKTLTSLSALLLAATAVSAQALAQAPAQARASAHSAQVTAAAPVHSASDIKWGPVPPVLPPSAKIAVLEGNPFGSGVYTLRLQMPDGYTVPPHFHPADEMVTVISGKLLFADGDNIDRNATQTLAAGGFVTAPANMHHYVIAHGPTVVQVHGMGPFAISYVHPTDDPRNRSK
jgi:quercetin dioxygenase-like cupin family protein